MSFTEITVTVCICRSYANMAELEQDYSSGALHPGQFCHVNVTCCASDHMHSSTATRQKELVIN